MSYLFLSVLALSVFIDNLMKNIYANPRPYMINLNIKIKHCDAGYGNPSGHSFSSTASYLAFYHIMTDITWFKTGILIRKIIRGIILFFTIVMVVTIMYSRFYLGVHSLNQLIYGCSCGLLLYMWFFTFLRFHKYSKMEFFNLFYKKGMRIFHGVMFGMLITLNFLLLFLNTHDTSEWNKLIEKFCPNVYIYRRFDNDAGINSLTILALIGAYIGLSIILSWRNSIDNEGERYDDLNKWNNSNCKRFFLRLLLTLVIAAVSFSLFLIVSGNNNLALVIIFKICFSFLAVGLSLFGLIIYLSIKFKLANENFDVEEGGYTAKLNQRDDV